MCSSTCFILCSVKMFSRHAQQFSDKAFFLNWESLLEWLNQVDRKHDTRLSFVLISSPFLPFLFSFFFFSSTTKLYPIYIRFLFSTEHCLLWDTKLAFNCFPSLLLGEHTSCSIGRVVFYMLTFCSALYQVEEKKNTVFLRNGNTVTFFICIWI